MIADYYDGLEILDIADPIHPVKLGSLDTDGFALSVRSFEKAGNQYAVIADGYKGLKIINITDLRKPTL